MRVRFSKEVGTVIILFSLTHIEMAKLVLGDAIARYKKAGFDTRDIEQILASIDDTPYSMQ